MPMPTGNGENPQFYGQWTVWDSQNWLRAKSLARQRNLSAWIPGLSTFKVTGLPATLRASPYISTVRSLMQLKQQTSGHNNIMWPGYEASVSSQVGTRPSPDTQLELNAFL